MRRNPVITFSLAILFVLVAVTALADDTNVARVVVLSELEAGTEIVTLTFADGETLKLPADRTRFLRARVVQDQDARQAARAERREAWKARRKSGARFGREDFLRLRGGRSLAIDELQTMLDGEATVPLLARVSRDADGRIRRFEATVFDSVAGARAELSLRESMREKRRPRPLP